MPSSKGSSPGAATGRAARQIVVSVVMLLLGAVLTGCSSGTPAPQALSDAQAQELSLARFSTYRLGTATLAADFTMRGTSVALTGWVDYPAGVGYAESAENGSPRNLLMWDSAALALKRIARGDAPPLPQPELDSTWGTAAINTAQSELQQILVIIVSLGADRPDNPLLVQQGGARFLRNDRIDGAEMHVYAVPPTPSGRTADAGDERAITYWIEAGGAIRRAAFTLAGGASVTISLTVGDGPRLHNPFTTGAGSPPSR